MQVVNCSECGRKMWYEPPGYVVRQHGQPAHDDKVCNACKIKRMKNRQRKQQDRDMLLDFLDAK